MSDLRSNKTFVRSCEAFAIAAALGVFGYALVRGVYRVVRQAYVEFVSG